jgi:hypothetical protein
MRKYQDLSITFSVLLWSSQQYFICFFFHFNLGVIYRTEEKRASKDLGILVEHLCTTGLKILKMISYTSIVLTRK